MKEAVSAVNAVPDSAEKEEEEQRRKNEHFVSV